LRRNHFIGKPLFIFRFQFNAAQKLLIGYTKERVQPFQGCIIWQHYFSRFTPRAIQIEALQASSFSHNDEQFAATISVTLSMIIRIPMRFEGSKGDKTVYALFDGGATYSCIAEENIHELEEAVKLHTPLRLATASASTFMEITQRTTLDFYHEDVRLSDEFLIVPGLSEEVIIGAATMQKWRLKLDFENDKVIVDPGVAKLILINLIKRD
jgi:hypothetical protein